MPPGATAPAGFASTLRALRSAGNEVQWLVAQSGPKPAGFASLAIIRFARESDLEAWMRGDAALLGAPLRVRRADVLVHEATTVRPSDGAFFAVNHYAPFVTQAEYLAYSRSYVVPNMAHQKHSGALLAYTMYFERAPAGATANAVLVKEYGSPDDQARGEAEKERYKTDVLLKQAEWKRIHESKRSVRADLSETFARPVALDVTGAGS